MFFKGPTSGPVLITEGNGAVAYRVATRLLASGYPDVRVGVPDPATAAGLAEAGATVVPFDWTDLSTYDPALNGVKTVFCAMPHHPDWDRQFTTFFKACKSAGVRHFVKLSFYHALASQADTMDNFVVAHENNDPFLKVPLVQMHRECDAHVMKSFASLNYAILFASHFMSNPLVYQSESLRKDHTFYGASAGKGVNYVSPNDVAMVAVRIILAPKEHHRVGYTLTGASPIKDAEIAAILGKRMGTTVTYVDKPLDAFAGTTKDPDWGPAADVVDLEQVKATGTEEAVGFVSKDVEKVCGRAPESYDDYIMGQEHMSPRELPCLGASA